MKSPWICPKCGRTNNTGNFCGACGTSSDAALKDAKDGEKVNMKSPWTCPKCGRTNNTGNFCGKCGTASEDAMGDIGPEDNINLENTWTCPKCGRTNNKGNFCGTCGTAATASVLSLTGQTAVEVDGNFIDYDNEYNTIIQKINSISSEAASIGATANEIDNAVASFPDSYTGGNISEIVANLQKHISLIGLLGEMISYSTNTYDKSDEEINDEIKRIEARMFDDETKS